MGVVRFIGTIVVLAGVVWAAWFIGWYAGNQSSGTTIPPPPGITVSSGI